MRKMMLMAIMTVAANTALAAGNETSGFGPAGSLELNGTLSETLAGIRLESENFIFVLLVQPGDTPPRFVSLPSGCW